MSEIEKLIAWLGDVVSVTPDNRLPVYLSSGEAGQLHVEITRLREENARQAAEIERREERETVLVAALKNIADPIAHMRREAAAQGLRLDGGMAQYLAKDPGYLRGIARAALAQEPTDD